MPKIIRFLLSFIYPITVELDKSEINPVLEVVLNNGVVIFNKVIYTREFKDQIPALKSLYNECFGNLNLYTIMHTGKIFVCTKYENG